MDGQGCSRLIMWNKLGGLYVIAYPKIVVRAQTLPTPLLYIHVSYVLFPNLLYA